MINHVYHSHFVNERPGFFAFIDKNHLCLSKEMLRKAFYEIKKFLAVDTR